MRKFKRLTLTLALLLTAVGGAWAQDTYNVTFKANNKTTTVENVTLPKTFQCSYNNADGDLDLILKELYGWTGDSSETICANWSTPKSSDANKVVAGKNGNDHYITIDNVFEGTVTITGDYIVDLELTQYSLEISIAEPTEWSLTPDETGKTWTLDKMPASNIELQVEYFAESNLFLSKDALADKANIAVKAGDLGVQFGDDGKSANTITEGTPMTVKYNGTKKILGFKVEKMAVAEGHALTSAKFGEIVCSDGKAYAAADKDILPKGVKAEALVCYVDGEHGLALAMMDVKNAKMSWDNDRGANDGKTAAEWCTGWNTSHPITGATWLLASKTQWSSMISAAGSASNLSNAFSAVGGTNLQAYSYWSSTPNIGVSAWRYHFPSSSWSWTYLNQDNTGSYIRACLEW